jgi:hypothetical protein
MQRRWDNSVQSSNTPTVDQMGVARDSYMMYRCLVIKVIFTDDAANISKNAKNPEVLYDVAILGGQAEGQILSNCRLASYLGGNDNYTARDLTATTKPLSKTRLADHDGDIVYVQFVQGHTGYPVIVGLAKGVTDKFSGSKKADGPRFLEVYNGFTTNITNTGELIRSLKGGKTTDQRFTADKEDLIKEQWFKTEKIVRTYKSGLVITENGKDDVVKITTKGGLEASVDGKGDKVELKTKGGVTATIDGTGNKITLKAKESEITIDGATGKITLKGEMIDLGKSVSDFVTQFTQLATAFALHTHITTGPGAPTSPPTAPLLTSVGSLTVKVQP